MNKKILASVAIAASLVATLLSGGPAQANTAPPPPQQVSYIATPHPDDEWQTWALTENSSSNYKVFILFTQGEQTQYCGPGKWQQACKDARLSSWLGFFTQMRQTDPAMPGDWEDLGRTAPLDPRGYSLTVDNGAGLTPADTSARVWRDRGGRGAAVVFDLGDGDLTAAEVQWAIDTVRDNRTLLGINDTLPNWNLLGTFYNAIYPNCAYYAHPDHRAVHEALWNVNFGMRYQSAASCATDPDGVRIQYPTGSAKQQAWYAGQAFKTNYGWLGPWTFSENQSNLFMGTQAFWTRHAN